MMILKQSALCQRPYQPIVRKIMFLGFFAFSLRAVPVLSLEEIQVLNLVHSLVSGC